jgi:hypothetical protein
VELTSDLASSARARLLRARTPGEEFERTLVRYAAERFLYRLGVSPARERCILKGASLLAVWMRDPYRATRDVDVLASGSPDFDTIRSLVGEICDVPCPEDGLRLDVSDLELTEIRAFDEYAGVRARFLSFLGAARIRIQVDFGFGDALVGGPEEVELPTLLDGIPAPRVRGYTREASIAEKFEAMVSLDTRNTRMKDFHDIWALSSAFRFEGPALRQAVEACFARRATPWLQELPRALTPAFYQSAEIEARWRGYLSAGGVLVAPPNGFDVIGERIIRFLGPVRDSIAGEAAMDLIWRPAGPWGGA